MCHRHRHHRSRHHLKQQQQHQQQQQASPALQANAHYRPLLLRLFGGEVDRCDTFRYAAAVGLSAND
jgi:hypothetical protein